MDRKRLFSLVLLTLFAVSPVSAQPAQRSVNYPTRSTTENLAAKRYVLAMELIIDPDLGKNQAIAALADWRIAGDVPTGAPLRWCDR